MDIVIGIDCGHSTGYSILFVPEEGDRSPIIFENGVVPFFSDKGRTGLLFDFWTRLFQRLPACRHLIFCYEANVGTSFASSFFYATEQATNIVLGDLVWQKLRPWKNKVEAQTMAIKTTELARLFGICSKGTVRKKKVKKDKEKVKIRTMRELLREAIVREFGLDESGLGKSLDVWDAIILARAGVYKALGDCKENKMDFACCDTCETVFALAPLCFRVCSCGDIMARYRDKSVVEVKLRKNSVRDSTRIVGLDNSVLLGHNQTGECSVLPWDSTRLAVSIMEIEHRKPKATENSQEDE